MEEEEADQASWPQMEEEQEESPPQREASIYALTPNARWLSPTWTFPVFGLVFLATLAATLFLDWTFESVRLWYTATALLLLAFRLYYYYRKQWLLYFFDLCYANAYALLAALWLCPTQDCSREWQLVYTMATGAVAGACFPLQTSFALHHAEAFMSFFLHVSPMWVCYAMRWRFSTETEVPGVFDLATNCLQYFYVIWFVPYLTILLLLPFFPDRIAGLETLPDCQLLPGMTHQARLEFKRQNYFQFVKQNLMAMLAHAALSLSGFVAAGMAYQYHAVQLTWTCCVLLTCFEAGYQFYVKSSDPNAPGNTLVMGFKKMGLAWVAMLAVYSYCVWSSSSVRLAD